MGMVVEFRQQPGRVAAPEHVADGQSAEIVIFPGVRIERSTETPAEAGEAQPKKSGPAAGKGRSKRR